MSTVESGAVSKDDDGSSAAAKQDTRRAKACEHCRSLKVRCIPVDPLQPDNLCVRCMKGKRECIFHVGPRKRIKKTDT